MYRFLSLLLLWLALVTAQAQAQAPAQRDLGVVDLRPTGFSQAPQLYGESHALVIGASRYAAGWSELPGVRSDMGAVADLLRGQGFKVETLADPTRSSLDETLRRFANHQGANPANRLLVYFAGHGHTLTTGLGKKLGYLVPVDAPRPDRDLAGFRQLAYSMENFEQLSRQIEAKHVLFVFDSCFSGTVFRSRSDVPDAISELTEKPVRLFITAGDENQKVPDESIFRRQLERALGREAAADVNGDGYITGTELGSYLHEQVTNYSKRSQTPRWGKLSDPDLDRGDLVFLSSRSSTPRRVADRTETGPRSAGRFVQDCEGCPELVSIPAGSFLMGNSSPEAPENERPQHRVSIKGFLMGRYHVTRGEYARFVRETGYRSGKSCYVWSPDYRWNDKEGYNWARLDFSQDDSHPVVCIAWQDAKEYLSWLSEKTGKRYRLPTESEWEYAARAGVQQKAPWNKLEEQCAYANASDQVYKELRPRWMAAPCRDRYAHTSPVGSYLPNAFGLYDMLGNARQWVEDTGLDTERGVLADYSGAPTDGSAWTSEKKSGVYIQRGCSYFCSPEHVTFSFRSHQAGWIRWDYQGFRVVREQ